MTIYGYEYHHIRSGPVVACDKSKAHCNIELILKTIGNRKGDLTWSCSRWQTQPEKICKLQRTNQCHLLRTLYRFVLPKLQIFSGCVCHLEQPHAQSLFLFPIVFSINFFLPVIWFLFSIFAQYLLFFLPGCSGMCCSTWATAWSQLLLFVAWLRQLGFGGSLRAATLNLCSSPNHLSNRGVLHDGRKQKTVVFLQTNALR